MLQNRTFLQRCFRPAPPWLLSGDQCRPMPNRNPSFDSWKLVQLCVNYWLFYKVSIILNRPMNTIKMTYTFSEVYLQIAWKWVSTLGVKLPTWHKGIRKTQWKTKSNWPRWWHLKSLQTLYVTTGAYSFCLRLVSRA